MNTDEPSLPLEIDVAATKQLLESQDVVLLDVREQDEYDFVKIDGSRLLPMSQIQQRLAELEPLQQQHLIIHCHHGGRSLQVTQWLRQQGFPRVQNMQGGIDAWSLQIDPTLPRYG